MAVSAFLQEVNIGLISDKQLVTAIAKAQRCGIVFIAITQHHSMEFSADLGCNGSSRTVAKARIHHFFLMDVSETCGHIGTITHPV